MGLIWFSISTGLKPGVASRHRYRAASAAWPRRNKPLKRLWPPHAHFTGLKPGAWSLALIRRLRLSRIFLLPLV